MKTVIQPPGWNPFQTFLMCAAIAGGVLGLIVREKTSQIAEETLPYWVLCIWYTGLAIGGICVLTGVYVNIKFRLNIEIFGLGLLGCIGLGYSVLIAVVSGRPFSYPVLITIAFSFACIIRIWQIINIINNPDKSQEVIIE